MERTGEVTSVDGEWLVVTFCRATDCAHCNSCMGPKKASVRVKGTAQVGDAAVVSLPENTVSRASLLAWALPLCAMLGCMFLGGAIFPENASLAGGIGGVVGLLLAGAVVGLTEKRRRGNADWENTLVRVIPAGEKA